MEQTWLGECRLTHRILALVTDAFGGHGGIARYNRNLLSALAAQPTAISIIAVPRFGGAKPAELPDNMVQVTPVPTRTRYAGRALRLAFNSEPFDAVFCGHLYMAPLAAAVSRLLGARLWLQLHGIEAWERPGKLVQKAAAQAGLVTAVSRYTRRRFLAWAEVDPGLVRVLPNTVEPRFSPGPKPVELARRLGVEGRKILLTVSRLAASERYKGHDRVIAALPLVLSRYPETVYFIAGDGDDQARLKLLVTKARLSSAVRFLAHVADEDLVNLYRLADVFIMPSIGEGFGIVFLEAAACGLQIIGGNRDGSWDALREGALGQTIDPLSRHAIVDAVCRAFASERPSAHRTTVFSNETFNAHAAAVAQEFMRGCAVEGYSRGRRIDRLLGRSPTAARTLRRLA